MTIAGCSERPAALRMAVPLLVAATLPFLALGVAMLAVPLVRIEQLTGLRPKLASGPVGYRAAGVAVLVLAAGYVALAVLALRRRAWARTGVATATGVGDSVLLMVLLAGSLRPGWLLLGASVLLASLAGIVLIYQPEVDRHLAGGDEAGGDEADVAPSG